MANFELRFNCESMVSYCKVEVKNVDNDQPKIIEVSIFNKDENNNQSVWLDISTAIKFAKTLRTEINKAKEVTNG